MTSSPARQTFRETVAQVAENARARLPQTVNGRIESAIELVLAYDVMPQADGSILVGSSRDPLKSYLLTGQSCECQDFTRGQAPDGWCKHRIAAGIHKRVQAMAAQSTTVETQTTPVPGGGRTADTTPAPCPEAAFSLTLKGTLAGVEALLTARGQTAEEFKRNLAAIRGLLDPVAPTALPAASQPQGKEWCQVHQVAMKQTTKDGRSWYSHRTDQGWCKGK